MRNGLRIIVSIFTFTALLCFPKSVFARIELGFSAPPAEVEKDKEFSVDVTVSGAEANAEYYIRGVLFKPNTTQYFGFTQNNQGEWQTSTSDVTKFYKVQGNSTTSIHFKADVHSPLYQPNSTYSFKISRYTPGGSLTWSEQTPASIQITSSETAVSPEPTASTSATPTPTTIHNNLVLISEVVACPPVGEQEWVELYNTSDSEKISLSGWKLRDSSNHEVSLSEDIQPKNYFVYSINSSLLNNSGDSVSIVNQQGEVSDTMSYEDCQMGTSFIKQNDQWVPTTTTTKQLANTYTFVAPTATATPKPTATLRETPAPTTKPVSHSQTELTTKQTASSYKEIITIFPEMLSMSTSSAETEVESDSDTTTGVSLPPTKPQTNSKLSFLLGGGSYILCAAVLAQKWYNLLSV